MSPVPIVSKSGVLPELDALGGLLEAHEQWWRDAAGVRARMLTILGAVADRYLALGAHDTSAPPYQGAHALLACRIRVSGSF